MGAGFVEFFSSLWYNVAERGGSSMFLENFILIAQQVLVLFILIAVGFACGKLGVLTEHA